MTRSWLGAGLFGIILGTLSAYLFVVLLLIVPIASSGEWSTLLSRETLVMVCSTSLDALWRFWWIVLPVGTAIGLLIQYVCVESKHPILQGSAIGVAGGVLVAAMLNCYVVTQGSPEVTTRTLVREIVNGTAFFSLLLSPYMAIWTGGSTAWLTKRARDTDQ